MTTLTDFLLARIAEDEARAGHDDGSPTPQGMWDPARVLAECEAKRQIVEMEPDCAFDRFQRVAWDDCHETALRLLALPYTDHPEYQEAWKP